MSLPRSVRGNTLAWCAAALFAWLSAWRALTQEWSVNEQYQFGWGIPFLFAWIVWRRWGSSSGGASCAWPWTLAGIGAVFVMLGEILRWKDPIWRLTGAMLAAGALCVTSGLFYRLGGAALLKRQAFALAFSWFAVPWPVSVDQWVALGLLRFITAFDTVVLGLIGIPALQHGNLIELRNGVVGVEEACSGICSLQASIVASVFLGEYFRLSPARRWTLGLFGLFACMAANCLRVLTLTLLTHRWGGDISESWHDSIGGAATGLSFLSLGFVAYKLAAKSWEDGTERPAFAWPVLRGRDGWVALTGFLALPLGAWALFHPPRSATGSQRSLWVLNCRDLPSGWSAAQVEPPRGAAAALHFTRWESCQFQSPEGWPAQVTHLFWKSGETIPGTAFFHTPALCLSSAGWRNVAEVETWQLDHHGRRLTVAAYHLVSPESRSVVAIQSLSIGGETDAFMADLNHPSGSFNRLALLWREPARRIDEEILAYMPDLGSRQLQTEGFSKLLNLVLAPNTQNR